MTLVLTQGFRTLRGPDVIVADKGDGLVSSLIVDDLPVVFRGRDPLIAILGVQEDLLGVIVDVVQGQGSIGASVNFDPLLQPVTGIQQGLKSEVQLLFLTLQRSP